MFFQQIRTTQLKSEMGWPKDLATTSLHSLAVVWGGCGVGETPQCQVLSKPLISRLDPVALQDISCQPLFQLKPLA